MLNKMPRSKNMGNKTGNQLKQLRKEHGLSQEKFAHEIGVSRQIISRWEKGKVTPNTTSVKKICDYYKINSDLFINTNNPAGDVESRLVVKTKLKIVFKCILSILLFLFIFYVVYSVYKYLLLKDLAERFKEYDKWTNYYAEIRTIEEAKLIGKNEIWYRNGKYKIVNINSFENQIKIANIKWLDCESGMIVEYNQEKDEYVKYKTLYKEEDYKDGKLIKKYLDWISLISANNIKELSLQPNIIYLKNIKDKKILKFGSKILRFDSNNQIPETFVDNTNERIVFKYYTIILNEVDEEDIEIKKDL